MRIIPWQHNRRSALRAMKCVSTSPFDSAPQSGEKCAAKRSVGTSGWVVLCTLLLAISSPAFAQRNLKDIPNPDPELERKTFTLPEGFEVNLYAGDPLLAKPIQMNFDAQGRLWVASSETYPHIKPGEKSHDKILVLEDTDEDGKADKTTVFADDLLIPTGVLPGDGGCYVANSTDLLFLKDTDDDGKADKRRAVLSGFGTEDTHHLLHTLRWGVDGSIFMNQSIYIHSHVETPHGVKRLNGGGIWQFRPDSLKLNIFCRGFVNPWGHHQDRFGQSFATDGAYGEGINYVFPGSIFVTAPGEKRRLKGLNPGSPKHCGLEIVSGRHLPDDWQGNMLTCDFRAHRVCRFVVTEDGSGFASRQDQEVIKSSHVAFRPIDVKMGPDGAIYIADWYNPIIQHGEVDFRDPRRDHVHGRIWRVTAKDRPLVKRPKIVGAPIGDLLNMLLSPEASTRLWAKQELKSRDRVAVHSGVEKWIAEDYKKWPFFDGAMLELAWLNQTLNEASAEPSQHLLESAVPQIRAAAVRIASEQSDPESPPVKVFTAAVRDENPRVRLEAVRALAKVPSAEAAAIAAAVLDQPMDRWLDFALWQTMRDLEPYWLPALQKGEIDFGGNVEHLTFALKAVDSPQIVDLLLARFKSGEVTPQQVSGSAELIATLGNAKQIEQLVAIITSDQQKLTPAQQATLLESLVAITVQRRLRLGGDMPGLIAMTNSEDESLRIQAIRAAGAWRINAVAEDIRRLAAGDGEPSTRLQRAALESLAMNGDAAGMNVLLTVSADATDAGVRGYAIAQASRSKPDTVAKLAASFLASLKHAEHVGPVVTAVVAHKVGPKLLADALADKKLNSDVAKIALRAARGAPGDTSALQNALRAAGSLSAEPKKYTPEEIAALVADVKAQGDPQRGEAIYRRAELQCLKCHAIGGAGGKVGPDMISIGASAQIDYLVESLVDPNAKVKENFHSIVVETDEGKVYSGIPVQRTENQLVLRDQDDKEVTLAVASIEAEREGRSLMPEGLIEPLTRNELVDLTRFLSELGKDGPFAIGKENVVRSWQKLIYTDEGHRRLNRTSHDTAATDDAALTWQSTTSRVNGQLPLEELHPFVLHRGHPAVSFMRFEIEVTNAGDVCFDFGEVDGLTLWVDGQATKITPRLTLALSPGSHVFTVAIDRNLRKTPIKVARTESSE